MNLVFGEMSAEFLKRADSDVLFRSSDGGASPRPCSRPAMSGERVTVPVADRRVSHRELAATSWSRASRSRLR